MLKVALNTITPISNLVIRHVSGITFIKYSASKDWYINSFSIYAVVSLGTVH